MSTVITEEQINQFVRAWFLALDRHVSLEEISRFLADSDLEMKFPEKSVKSLDDFAAWYTGVIKIFFDEQHNVVSVESTITGDQADLDIVAAWTTLWIVPPEPNTRRVSLDSVHKWRVRTSNKNAYGLEIVSYEVNLQYAPGSARL